jgi:antitoxin YefM
MQVTTYSEARAKLKTYLDQVCDDHNPLVIARKNNRSVVMISLEDYEAMEEKAYLLSTNANAQRLTESIEQYQRGELIYKTMEELEGMAEDDA